MSLPKVLMSSTAQLYQNDLEWHPLPVPNQPRQPRRPPWRGGGLRAVRAGVWGAAATASPWATLDSRLREIEPNKMAVVDLALSVRTLQIGNECLGHVLMERPHRDLLMHRS